MLSLCLSILLLYCSAAAPIERFYPFGANTADQRLPPNDDETYATSLSTVFPFFDVNYTTLYVSGIL